MTSAIRNMLDETFGNLPDGPSLKSIMDQTFSEPACNKLAEIINLQFNELTEIVADDEDTTAEDKMNLYLLEVLVNLPAELLRISANARLASDMVIDGRVNLNFPELTAAHCELLDSLLNDMVEELLAAMEEHIIPETDLPDEEFIQDVLGVDAEDDEYDPLEELDDDDEELDVDDDPVNPIDMDDITISEDDLLADEDPEAVENISEVVAGIPCVIHEELPVINELVRLMNHHYKLPGYAILTLRRLNGMIV